MKVGRTIAPAALSARIAAVQQYAVSSAADPAQAAVAATLRAAAAPYGGQPTYNAALAADYRAKRDAFVVALTAAGLSPVVPDGAFFVVADGAVAAVAGAREIGRYRRRTFDPAPARPSAANRAPPLHPSLVCLPRLHLPRSPAPIPQTPLSLLLSCHRCRPGRANVAPLLRAPCRLYCRPPTRHPRLRPPRGGFPSLADPSGPVGGWCRPWRETGGGWRAGTGGRAGRRLAAAVTAAPVAARGRDPHRL